MTVPVTYGQIYTFYSYKGGTGRTMALANVACLLAQRSSESRVLMIDWDLEAPGLHRFFQDWFSHFDSSLKDGSLDDEPGLLELFSELFQLTQKVEYKNEIELETITNTLLDKVDLERFILETDIPSLYLLKAGRFDGSYSSRVNTFNWEKMFKQAPWIFQSFSEKLSERFQYVLIDSRTGLSDTSGICTALMPEKLVVVFTPNHQSLTGVGELIQRAANYRVQSDDLRPILVYPLPSRIEASEPSLRDIWRFGKREQNIKGYQPQFEKHLKELYDLPHCSLSSYFNEVQIQHSPSYAYGEKIAVLVEESGDRLSLTRSYESFTEWLVDHNGPWDSEVQKVSIAQEEKYIKSAEKIYARFSQEEKDLTRQIFTRLVKLARPEEGGEDTRKRARISELNTAVGPVLDTLAKADLIIIGKDEKTGDGIFELSNDALIRGWKRLKKWIDEDRDYLLWRQQVHMKKAEWERSSYDKAQLLRGRQLTDAQKWASKRGDDLDSTEKEYILASNNEYRRRYAETKSRKRNWAIGISAAFVLVVVLGIWLQNYISRSSEQQQIANSRALAAQANSLINSKLDLASLLSVEAVKMNNNSETRSALFSVLEKSSAIKLYNDRPIFRLAMSPDGQVVAACGGDNAIRFLYTYTRSKKMTVQLFSLSNEVLSLAFSPDGKTLVSGGGSSIIQLWDIQEKKESARLKSSSRKVNCVIFSPDGKTLASGGDGKTIQLWDIHNRKEIGYVITSGDIYSMAFSPDGKTLASGGNRSIVQVWDINTLSENVRLEGHVNFVSCLAFSPDGQVLATGSYDNTILLWDVWRKYEIDRLEGHTQGVTCLAFSPDGKVLASGGEDAVIRLWDMQSYEEIVHVERESPKMSISGLAFSPAGKTLLSSSIDGSIILSGVWDFDVESWIERASSIANRNLTVEEWKRYFGDIPYHETWQNFSKTRK